MKDIKKMSKEWTDPNELVRVINERQEDKKYDTLFILTDEQTSSSYLQKCQVKNVVVWNIWDSANSMIPSFEKWYTYITGFNDAIFELASDLNDISWIVTSINTLSIV